MVVCSKAQFTAEIIGNAGDLARDGQDGDADHEVLRRRLKMVLFTLLREIQVIVVGREAIL